MSPLKTARFALAALALPLAGCAHAPAPAAPPMTASLDLSTPEAAAYSMMRAMYQGDAAMVDAVFMEGATLRRVTPEGTLGANGLARWRGWVGGLEVGEANEQIFSLETEQFGDLATVWAPFVLTYKGDIAGCGVNTLTLARVAEGWRIASGMDTAAEKEACAGFRASY